MFKKILILFCNVFVLQFFSAQHAAEAPSAKENSEFAEREKTAEENREFIQHHVLDSHEFSILTTKDGDHVGFPLPVIIYDEGFHFFMSNKNHFESGGNTVESGGKYYTLFHEQIYRTDENGDLKLNAEHRPEAKKVMDLSITKNVFVMILVSLLMFWLFRKMALSYKKSQVPKGIAKFFEPIVLFVRDEVAIPNIGHKYRKYMGFLLTIFFFILFLNIFGLIPLGINVTGNITVTFGLALFTFLITTFSGNRHYWQDIFWMPGLPVIMKIIMIPIEILGMFTKPFALMIRLFANILGGHMVIMSLIALIFYFKNVIAGVSFPLLSLFVYVLEVLVAVLQAYIFTLLSAIYIGLAVEEHNEAEVH